MSSTTHYTGVQALRGFAVILAVLYHTLYIMRQKLYGPPILFDAGHAGVDIFFAISGFVIAITTASSWNAPHAAGRFMRRRLIRVVPLYWLMTTAMILFLLCMPRLAPETMLRLWHTIASFLFIPAWNGWHQTYPLLIVGWTLSFEMLFYTVFALALALRLKPVKSVSMLFIILPLIGMLRTDSWGAPATLLDPMLLEIVFGMWIGLATLKGIRLPVRTALWLTPLMLAAIPASCALSTGFDLKYRVIVWGIPAAVLLAGMVALEERLRPYFLGLPHLLGDASYAIYLSHCVVISMLNILMPQIHMNYAFVFALVVLAIISMTILGIVIHLYIERPLTVWLQKFPARAALPYAAG